MQLAKLDVSGLFGRYDHSILFPTRPEDGPDEAEPSIAILHGPNGVGKTTVLRMLRGLMELDFNPFRGVPFRSCEVTFSTGDALSVRPRQLDTGTPLEVSFRDRAVLLNPEKTGSYETEDASNVSEFTKVFFAFADGLTFDLIDTQRLLHQDAADAEDGETSVIYTEEGQVIRQLRPAEHRPLRPLARRVGRFFREAQVDYRRFFSRTEPELFPRIMTRLTAPDPPDYKVEDLAATLEWVRDQAHQSERLGLEVEPWDYDQLMSYLKSLSTDGQSGYALTVLGAYTEFLESRASQRALVADRLRTFELILDEFLLGKKVRVNARRGLIIKTDQGEDIEEAQLSSGEHHLLYLMVSALTTRRRGTVIAIDEPELSMHIAWQRKLIRKLVECASNASPQFVFATHSPEIVSDYRDQMIAMDP